MPLIVSAALFGASTAAAQAGAPSRKPQRPAARSSTARQPGRFEVSAQLYWLAGSDLGTKRALLTRNPADGTTPLALFSSAARLAPTPAFGASVGYNLTRTLEVEGSVVASRPALRATISGDLENAQVVSVSGDRLAQYFLGASTTVHLRSLRFARAVPFVNGGAGYLRQLHQGRTVVEAGSVYHVGGGVKYPLTGRTGRRLKTMGFRLDACEYFASGGLSLDGKRRTFPSAGAGLFFLF